MRSAVWDIYPQKPLTCFSNSQAEVVLLNESWFPKTRVKQQLRGWSTTLGSKALGLFHSMCEPLKTGQRLSGQMRVLSRHRATIVLFLYTNLFIFSPAHFLVENTIFVQINLLEVCQATTIEVFKSRDLMPEVVSKNKIKIAKNKYIYVCIHKCAIL